jgi:hypothetical protein
MEQRLNLMPGPPPSFPSFPFLSFSLLPLLLLATKCCCTNLLQFVTAATNHELLIVLHQISRKERENLAEREKMQKNK